MTWTDKDFSELKKGGKAAFEKLYACFKKDVYNYLHMKTRGNSDMVDELFAQTFHSAFTSVGSLKHNKNILQWLLQIAYRRFADQIRAINKHEKIKNYLKPEVLIPVNHDDILIENEKKLMIKLACDNIKPAYLEILNLKYLHKKSQEELADHYKKKVSTIQGMLFRAREALKNEIKKLEL